MVEVSVQAWPRVELAHAGSAEAVRGEELGGTVGRVRSSSVMGPGGGGVGIVSARMIKSSVSEGDVYDDIEEGEHSPSEVDDEGSLLTLDRFFPLANSEEDDILHLKSRCLLGIRLKTQILGGT